jgi:hypothetical protein
MTEDLEYLLKEINEFCCAHPKESETCDELNKLYVSYIMRKFACINQLKRFDPYFLNTLASL